MGSIYLIKNTVNNKCYVGQTINDPTIRIREHFQSANNGSKLIKQAMAKYGHDAFTFEIIHNGVLDFMLDDLEIEAIKKYNTISPNGYNLDGGGNLNKIVSESTRRKTSEALRKRSPESYRKLAEKLRGRPCPEHVKQKISKSLKGNQNGLGNTPPNKGVPMSDAQRRTISETCKGRTSPMKGKKHSAETRRKISEKLKGKRLSEEHRHKMSIAQKKRWENRKKIN